MCLNACSSVEKGGHLRWDGLPSGVTVPIGPGERVWRRQLWPLACSPPWYVLLGSATHTCVISPGSGQRGFVGDPVSTLQSATVMSLKSLSDGAGGCVGPSSGGLRVTGQLESPSGRYQATPFSPLYRWHLGLDLLVPAGPMSTLWSHSHPWLSLFMHLQKWIS